MMKEETRKNIEVLRNKLRNEMFTKEDVRGIVSIQTLKKYDLIETTSETYSEEVSLEELIEDINSMMGEDCYYCEGQYIQRDGKIFYERTKYGYKFK